MAIGTLEERLEILEREMTQVKARLEPQDSSKANPWLTHVYGAFKDDPLFRRVRALWTRVARISKRRER